MTYGDLVIAMQAGLPDLLRAQMPIKGAMAVRVLNRRVQAELTTYEEMRQALLEKHAAKDDAGKLLSGEDGNAVVGPEFWQEMNDLWATEAPAIEPVSVAILGEVAVTPAALTALGDLLVD